MSKLVECVPNFSEGRRKEVVDAIVAEARAVPGVSVLGCEMDADHNRSVLTFAGEAGPVAEAAFLCARKAADLIDLREHRGAHPRMGATDVVPFVPLGDSTMDECVALAKAFGRRLWEEARIPVYLYGAAARSPERRKLANCRKGQFEGIRDTIAEDPGRAPDFGDPAVHPSAGITAAGARFFLIAYNVNLRSTDGELAKRIGRAIREKDGGFPKVQAMGFDLPDRGRVQVSTNLLDYRVTGLRTVFDAVRRQAAEAGVEVAESEIVGLVPRGAVHQVAADHLKLDAPLGPQVIEDNLAGGGPEPLKSPGPFLDLLASDAAVPGGGSAAALAGSLGGALAAMVGRLTVGRKKYAEVGEEMAALVKKGEELRRSLFDQIATDARAYDGFMEAMKLPKESDREKAARREAMERAAKAATEAPLRTARLCLEVLEASAAVAARGNRNAASDGAVGALLARAGLRGAAFNVKINLPSVADDAWKSKVVDEVARLEQDAEALERQALEATGL